MKPSPPAAQIVASLNKSERRATLRLLKHWEAARGAASLPKLTDFDLSILEELGDSTFLLTVGTEDPEPSFRYFGRELAAQVGRDLTGRGIGHVPSSTLLSRVLGHYVETLQRRTPVGVHGRFEGASGRTLLYRGILLPFCSEESEVTALLGCYRSRTAMRPGRARSVDEDPAAATLTLSPEQMLAGYRAGKLQAIVRLAQKLAWPAKVVSRSRAAAPIRIATLKARKAGSEFVRLLAQRLDPERKRLVRAAEPDGRPPA
jgi:hypothetical protein